MTTTEKLAKTLVDCALEAWGVEENADHQMTVDGDVLLVPWSNKDPVVLESEIRVKMEKLTGIFQSIVYLDKYRNEVVKIDQPAGTVTKKDWGFKGPEKVY